MWADGRGLVFRDLALAALLKMAGDLCTLSLSSLNGKLERPHRRALE